MDPIIDWKYGGQSTKQISQSVQRLRGAYLNIKRFSCDSFFLSLIPQPQGSGNAVYKTLKMFYDSPEYYAKRVQTLYNLNRAATRRKHQTNKQTAIKPIKCVSVSFARLYLSCVQIKLPTLPTQIEICMHKREIIHKSVFGKLIIL